MKNWKIITIVGVSIVAAALLTSTVLAMGMMGGGYGGMMGGYGYGYNNPPYATGTTGTTTTAPSTQYYQPVFPFMFGGGCMGRFGWNGYTATTPSTFTGTTLNITTATTIAENYVASLNNPDLAVKQVEEYTANYYVQVNELSTGNGAFELLINKVTGSIYPEMGPNMMWNTKYGMMRSGVLGGIYGTPTTTMTVTTAQATTNSQQYLLTYIPGTTTGDVATFYGYYTIEVLSNGNPYGMLSVNSYTGQIWYHTWHGTFVQEQQIS